MKGSIKHWVSLFIVTALIFIIADDIAAEPAASLQESFWNFGEIQYGESVSKEFDIANAGQDELKIHRIQPSCVCIKGEIIKDTAIADAPAKIKVTFTVKTADKSLDYK